MDIRSLLTSEGRTAHTVEQYISLLERLHRRATGAKLMENLLWLNDVDSVSKALAEYKPASCKLYLVPVMLLLKKGQHEGLLPKYHALFVKAMHDMAGKRIAQKIDGGVVLESITQDDIERMKRVLAKKVKDTLTPKGPDSLNEKEKTILMQNLMLSLYTAVVPLRTDLTNVPIVRLGETHSDKSVDTVVEVCIKTFILQRAQKKRGNTNDEAKLEFSRALNNQIAESLRLFPRKYLLSNTTGDECMSQKILRQTFSAIFGKTCIPTGSIIQLFDRA